MKVNATLEEARWLARLVNAYSSAVSVVEQLRPMLDRFGLLKPSGAIDTNKVIAIHERIREQDPEPEAEADGAARSTDGAA